MMPGLLALAFLMALPGCLCGDFLVDPSSGMFVDSMGRRRIFHGVNAVQKLPPFIPSEVDDLLRSLNQNDMAKLQGWGMNVVRLGVFWSAVMPSKDQVNITYLSEIRNLITSLASFNISTIVDAHQDVLNSFMCGEGMPNWAFFEALDNVGFNYTDPSQAFPKPQHFELDRNEDGTPSYQDCLKNEFFSYYLTWQNEAAWSALYHNLPTTQLFGDYWEAVVIALKGTPGLLGYELINEPWPAEDPVKIAFSDSKNLLDFYTHLSERIRQVDDSTIIFFEPLTVDTYLEVVHPYTTDFPEGI